MSWLWWRGLILRGVTAPVDWSSSHLPGLVGPALAALVMVVWRDRWRGLAALGRALVRRWQNPVAVITALLVAPAVALVVLDLTDWPPEGGAILAYPGVPAGTSAGQAIAAALRLNAVGEEVGWRGYLLPRLIALGRVRGTLLLAVVWALWHWPAFLLPFGLGAQVVGVAVIGWGLGLMPGAFVLSWLWLRSGGALGAVVLWHLLFNLSTATAATAGPGAAVVSNVVMVWGFAILVLWCREPLARGSDQ